jgi:signal transduction histidine kinase
VNLELDEDLPRILGVNNRLEQVFVNLVINARDSMEVKRASSYQQEEESVLTIRSYQEEGKVVAIVRDTGIGMPESIRDRIFEPFFTTKEGLGLSISYGIVKDYGGTIEVESEVGSGTTFKVIFPVIAST